MEHKETVYAGQADHYVDLLGLEEIAKCIPYSSDSLRGLYDKEHGFDMSTPKKAWEIAAGWIELTPHPFRRLYKNTSCLFQRMLSEHGLSGLAMDACIDILKRAAERMVLDGKIVPVKIRAQFFASDGRFSCEEDVFVPGDLSGAEAIVGWVKENLADHAGMSIVCTLGCLGDGRPWLIPAESRA